MDFTASSFAPAPRPLAPSIDFPKELNPQQLAAVQAPFGPALVLAGAGSGKTRTLTYRVAYLLSKGVQPWNILLLTFTNKAAREMLQRVEALTGVESKRFWGGTFHHIGQRLLRTHGELLKLNPSFTILDQSEAESILNEAVKAADSGFLRDKNNPKVTLIANIISFARNTMQPLGDVIRARYPHLDDKIEPLNRFFDRYTFLKRSRNLCDYDDLLELLYRLLKDNPAVAAELSDKFQHLLVDEYQDTNAIQSAIIDLLAPHHRIMAVGDDAQCIYTWRGAEVENILSFPERHPNTQIYKIELNYRSTPPILNLANSVLTSTNKEFHKNLQPTRGGTLKPVIVPVVDGRAQAAYILSRISTMRAEGRRLDEIIVLYRAHFHAMELQLELTRLGIPFSITSGMRFFEQAHVKDLIAQLRFVFNPKDSAAFCRIMCLLPKVGEVTALKLFNEITALYNREDHPLATSTTQEDIFGSKSPDTPTDKEDSQTASQPRLGGVQGGANLGEIMKDPSIVARVGESARSDFLALADTIAELANALADGESPASVTHHAIEGWYSGFIRTIYPNWDSRLDDLASLESFANRFESFSEYLTQLVLLNAEASDKSPEPNEDTLRLSTVHQAKGLEFPVVFVIGLAEGMFPGRRAIEENTLDEERRLFYVAVTRAQDELFLTYPLLNMSAHAGQYQQLPSRFLEALPQDTFELMTVSAVGASSHQGGNYGGRQKNWKSGQSYGKAAESQARASRKTTSYGPSFSKSDGIYDDLALEKKFDSKTNQNAKKLFNW